MLDNLKADTRRLKEIKTKAFPWYVIESLLFENGYQAVVLHRMAHACKRSGLPLLGPFLNRLSLFLTGADIAPAAEIGPGLRISHGVGLVIGNGVRVGSRCLLMQNVTLGAPSQDKIGSMPTLGDDVVLGAGASVIGGVRVGDRVIIGINSVVFNDVPDDSKVLPTPSRVVPRSRQGEQPADDGVEA